MASPYAENKRRPPPIVIPPPPPRRVVPGPNAFAAQAKQDELQRHQEVRTLQPQLSIRSGPNSPATSPVQHDNDAHLPRTSSQTSKGRRSAAATAFANLIEQNRSPRKTDRGSMNSRYGSTTHSRYSERSDQSRALDLVQPEGLTEVNKTSRGELEAQNERKYFKMMGQIPETPVTHIQLPDNHVTTKDLRPDHRDSGSSKKDAKRDEPAKSPKKKIFGVSIPNFLTNSNAPTPPIPSKAAQVLGSPPGKTRRFSPRPRKPAALASVPRSDTSKSLPQKLYDHHSHSRRPNHHQTSSTSRSRPRTASRTSPAKAKGLQASHIKPPGLGTSVDLSHPPTPPQKDTPPKDVPLDDRNQVIWFLRAPPPEEPEEDEDFVDTGMKLHLPNVPQVDPISSVGGESPTKFRPYGAEDYARLIERANITSAHGEFEFANGKQAGSRTGSPDPFLRDERLSQEYEARPQLNTHFNNDVQTLPPTVYDPAKNPFPRALYRFGAVNHAEEGNEIGLATRVMRELQTDEQLTPGLRGGSDQAQLQPEQSSSQLTDMLNGASPSRVDYHNFQPNCPSAMPSPLHGAPVPHPTTSHLGPAHSPIDHVPLADHFFITNEHIDLFGRTLYDFAGLCNQHEAAMIMSKHDQLMLFLKQRFDGIKSQINSVSEKSDHTANQNHDFNLQLDKLKSQINSVSEKADHTSNQKHGINLQLDKLKSQIKSVSEKADHTSNQNNNINVQLDKLLDFIKVEVVQPLAVQAKKTADMEQSVKELRKAVQEMQTAVEQNKSSPAPFWHPPAAPTNFPLPVHRSQPSLAGFSSNNASRAPMPQPPTISESRRNDNDYRPHPPCGRENKEGSHAFAGATPYSQRVAQFGGGWVGGYPGYSYSPNSAEQHPAFNQAPPK